MKGGRKGRKELTTRSRVTFKGCITIVSGEFEWKRRGEGEEKNPEMGNPEDEDFEGLEGSVYFSNSKELSVFVSHGCRIEPLFLIRFRRLVESRWTRTTSCANDSSCPFFSICL